MLHHCLCGLALASLLAGLGLAAEPVRLGLQQAGPAPPFTPGTEINQYRIVKYLGSGLFAETYLATHSFLEIDRAIKVLHRGINSPEMFANYKERYRQEWQLAAGIHHPNLVEVYDVFEKDDAVFAVIEYAPNGTLKDILDQGQRQSEEWVVDVLRDCANGYTATPSIA